MLCLSVDGGASIGEGNTYRAGVPPSIRNGCLGGKAGSVVCAERLEDEPDLGGW